MQVSSINNINFKALKIDKAGQRLLSKIHNSELEALNKLGSDINIKASSFYDIVFSENAKLFLSPKDNTSLVKEKLFNLFEIAQEDSFNYSGPAECIEQIGQNTLEATIVEPTYGIKGSLSLNFEKDIDLKSMLNKYLNSTDKFDKIKNLLAIFELAEEYSINKEKIIQEKLSKYFV